MLAPKNNWIQRNVDGVFAGCGTSCGNRWVQLHCVDLSVFVCSVWLLLNVCSSTTAHINTAIQLYILIEHPSTDIWVQLHCKDLIVMSCSSNQPDGLTLTLV